MRKELSSIKQVFSSLARSTMAAASLSEVALRTMNAARGVFAVVGYKVTSTDSIGLGASTSTSTSAATEKEGGHQVQTDVSIDKVQCISRHSGSTDMPCQAKQNNNKVEN